MTKFIYYIDDKIVGSNIFSKLIHYKSDVAEIVNSFKMVEPNITSVKVYINDYLLVKFTL